MTRYGHSLAMQIAAQQASLRAGLSSYLAVRDALQASGLTTQLSQLQHELVSFEAQRLALRTAFDTAAFARQLRDVLQPFAQVGPPVLSVELRRLASTFRSAVDATALGQVATLQAALRSQLQSVAIPSISTREYLDRLRINHRQLLEGFAGAVRASAAKAGARRPAEVASAATEELSVLTTYGPFREEFLTTFPPL